MKTERTYCFEQEKFIPYLIENGFEEIYFLQTEQVIQMSKGRTKLTFLQNELEICRVNNTKTTFELPETLDQFKMMLACFDIIKLPRTYVSDGYKLEKIKAILKISSEPTVIEFIREVLR